MTLVGYIASCVGSCVSAKGLVAEYVSGNENVFRYELLLSPTMEEESPRMLDLVMQGVFFENDWSRDGTTSFVTTEE